MSEWENRYKYIADPIYDSIHIPGSLLSFINNPIFQNLRYKKQLSCAHLVYPSANHTRFEHSLGVFHLADLFLEKFLPELNKRIKIPHYFSADEISNQIRPKIEELRKDLSLGLLQHYSYEFLIGALYHDIGQSAFSHLIDNVKKRNPDLKILNDKEYSETLIRENQDIVEIFSLFNNKLKSKLENLFPSVNQFNDLGINIENIISMITKGSHLKPHLYFLGELLNSSIDFDRIDYLNRDSYFYFRICFDQ